MAFNSKYENGIKLNENEQKQIDSLDDKILVLEIKIEEIEKQIEVLNEEKRKIIDHHRDLEEEIVNQEFRDYLMGFDFKKSQMVDMSRCTSTIEILDKFKNGNKDFLVLRHQFRFNTYDSFDLVITPYYSGIRSYGLQPTMSELKQNFGVNVNSRKCERLTPLLKELEKFKHKDKGFGKINLLDEFYLIGGQNSSNRTGYGSEWYNGYCSYEGTLYGEVSDYLVVGIIPWE